MSTNPTQQAYNNWQAAKTPWYKQQTPTSKANEEQAEAAYTQALRNPQSSVKFGGQPGAGLAAQAMAQPPKPVAPSAPSDSLVAAAGVGAGPGRGSINPAPVNPSAPAPQATSLTNNITKTTGSNGLASYSGENISDGFTLNGKQTGGMLGGGAVSPQNTAAADRLSSGNSLVQRAGAIEPGGLARMQAPTVEHSGNSWQARENLRRQEMDATSLIHRSHWAPKGSGLAAQANYGRALAADQHAQGKQVDADVAAMQTNAGMQQEQMRQDGANRREGVRSLAEMARFQLDEQRLGMERETQQIQNRPRSLIAAMQEQIATEQDEARRGGLVQRMRDMEGKNAEVDPYLVVPGGQQSNEQGQIYTAPSSVFNRRSGAFLQQPSTAAIPIQNNPKAAEIRSNTSLTREQKVEALRKLGYS